MVHIYSVWLSDGGQCSDTMLLKLWQKYYLHLLAFVNGRISEVFFQLRDYALQTDQNIKYSTFIEAIFLAVANKRMNKCQRHLNEINFNKLKIISYK